MFINKYFLTFIYLLIYLKIKTLTVYLNLHVGNICNLSNKCVKNILRYSILELSIFSVYSCGPGLHHWLYWDSLPGGGCQPAVLLPVPPQGQDQPLQDWPFLYCWNSGFHFPPFLAYSLRVGLQGWWKTLHLAKQNTYFWQYEDIVFLSSNSKCSIMLSNSLIILTLFINDTTPVLALILNHNHTIINSQIENTQEEDKILWYNCTSYSYNEAVGNIRYM